jgi:hypothetical protein
LFSLNCNFVITQIISLSLSLSLIYIYIYIYSLLRFADWCRDVTFVARPCD